MMPSVSIAFSLAAIVPLAWATDCDFDGGFAVRKPGGCGGDAPVVCEGGISPRCCPAGSYCHTTDNAYCCPTEEDCLKSILDIPKCPRQDWSLYLFLDSKIKNSWCCDDHSVGVIRRLSNAVACSPLGSVLASDEVTAVPAKDLKSTCTVSTTSSSLSSSSATTTHEASRASVTAIPTQEDEEREPLIGSGPIAGIVVGGVAGVTLAIAGAFWLLSRRRGKRNKQPDMGDESKPAVVYPTREADSTPVHELSGNDVLNHQVN